MIEMKMTMTDGLPVHAIYAEPSSKPVAHIHLLHGMAEHIGRYEGFIHYLTGKGYIVSGHDHRGHGRTSQFGKLGHFGDSVGFERVVEDAYEVATYFKHKFKAPKFILFGHSMGSFIARRYSQRFGDEIDLLICSGTASDPGISRTGGQLLAKLKGHATSFDKQDHFINKLVFGAFKNSVASPKTPFDWLTRDKGEVEKYLNDPLCGFVPTTGFFIDLFECLETIHRDEEVRKTPKKLPILLLSGKEDPVGEKGKGVWKVAHQYIENGIDGITVMLYEGGRHEMLHEVNHEDVFKFITDWIEN